jgi:maleate cis-trans isomerase
MKESETTYLVGTVNPTSRPGPRSPQLDDKLPPNVKFISNSMNFSRGTEEEFGASMPGYEAKVAELVEKGADLVRPSGAPPFMLLGFEGEKKIIRAWEEKYGAPMFTSGQSHVRALRALGIRTFVGASYFPDGMNAVFARYFSQAGFNVLAMEGLKVAFADVPKVPPMDIFDAIEKMFEKHSEADGIYLLGSAWKTLEILEPLEKTLGVPLIHPAPARCWETQLRLGFRHPIAGYGRLLAEMPPLGE